MSSAFCLNEGKEKSPALSSGCVGSRCLAPLHWTREPSPEASSSLFMSSEFSRMRQDTSGVELLPWHCGAPASIAANSPRLIGDGDILNHHIPQTGTSAISLISCVPLKQPRWYLLGLPALLLGLLHGRDVVRVGR